MKIELKLTNDELICINNQLQEAYGRRFGTLAMYNVVHSISLDLADKFDAKAKSLIKKANIFSVKRNTKITLKYHEAWALKIFLNEAIQRIDNDYYRTLVQKTINILDQKLQ